MEPVKTSTNCPLCGNDAERVRGPREISVGRRQVTVDDDYVRCSSCDEDFYMAGQLEELQRRASDQIREAEGLLTPGEIVALRKDLGLSQTALEELLGVGPKTVIRWEKGTVFQSRAADRLLRLVKGLNGAVAFLTTLSNVEGGGTPPPLQVTVPYLARTTPGRLDGSYGWGAGAQTHSAAPSARSTTGPCVLH